MVEHGIIIDSGSTIEMEVGANDQYDLDFGIHINPGEPSGGNYNILRNKPQINGITLQGDIPLQDLDLQPIYAHTTEYWNSMPSLQSLQGAIYIYTDYKTIEEDGVTKNLPGIKIGDGDAYVIDLPFISDSESKQITTLTETVNAHIGAVDAHTSSAEKEFWNNKVTASLNPNDPTNLILSKL